MDCRMQEKLDIICKKYGIVGIFPEETLWLDNLEVYGLNLGDINLFFQVFEMPTDQSFHIVEIVDPAPGLLSIGLDKSCQIRIFTTENTYLNTNMLKLLFPSFGV